MPSEARFRVCRRQAIAAVGIFYVEYRYNVYTFTSQTETSCKKPYMIIRPVHRFQILYILQGSFFSKLWKPLLALFVFSTVVAYYQSHLLKYHIPLNTSVFTLLGIALAIFHGFCNASAYDRFWEGRKQWGNLLHVSRSFCRKILTLPNVPDAVRTEMLALSITFAHCLRHQLRRESPQKDICRTAPEKWNNRLLASDYPAMTCCQILGEYNAALLSDGIIDTICWHAFEDTFAKMSEIQAACERINNTPIPFAYFVLMHRTVHGYCFLLPFGLVNAIGWVTPFMATFVGYTFMCLNEIVDEIGEPFGKNENDLSLTQICQTIETQLCTLSGLTLPPSSETARPSPCIVQ